MDDCLNWAWITWDKGTKESSQTLARFSVLERRQNFGPCPSKIGCDTRFSKRRNVFLMGWSPQSSREQPIPGADTLKRRIRRLRKEWAGYHNYKNFLHPTAPNHSQCRAQSTLIMHTPRHQTLATKISHIQHPLMTHSASTSQPQPYYL